MDYLTIALPKGKLFSGATGKLREIGFAVEEVKEDSRRMVFVDEARGVRFLVARASDVPTFVEYGAADLGIVGKDTLLEAEQRVYELLDLGFGLCRFVVAAPRQLVDPDAAVADAAREAPSGGADVLWRDRSSVRVATKFPRVAQRHFARSGRPVEVILLHGSVELAPSVGLAQAIVDLVETGRTLRENGLVELEEIARSTARLIGNGVAMRLKREQVEQVAERLRTGVEAIGSADPR